MSIPTNSNPITGKADSYKQVIMHMNSKIPSFKPDNVVLVHGKLDLVTDVGENGLMKFRSFTNPRNWFEDAFLSGNIGIFKCSIVSH